MPKREQSKRYCIALDAMGGDLGPSETVKAAVRGARLHSVDVILIGEEALLNKELSKFHTHSGVSVMPSVGVIEEGEHPVKAIRSNPLASIVVACGLVAESKADAVVSMGSTGASMASATLTLGLLEGLERPALGGNAFGLVPNISILDLGSSVDCRPNQLVNFAVIGSVYAKTLLSIHNPRVGLLSVGAEEGKGNKQIQETYSLLRDSTLNFVGNVEGFDVFLDKADVIVCDGFVGNILLKFGEGFLKAMEQFFYVLLKDSLTTHDSDLIKSKFESIGSLAENGGGPLFGVKGVVVVGHGSSRSDSIVKSIEIAKRCLSVNLVSAIGQGLADFETVK